MEEYWSKIIFSDECTIKSGHNNRVWVWKKAGEKRYRPDMYGDKLSAKLTKFKVNVWGYITQFGQGTLKVMEGRVNAHKYINVSNLTNKIESK